jgi:hypothetical protein
MQPQQPKYSQNAAEAIKSWQERLTNSAQTDKP